MYHSLAITTIVFSLSFFPPLASSVLVAPRGSTQIEASILPTTSWFNTSLPTSTSQCCPTSPASTSSVVSTTEYHWVDVGARGKLIFDPDSIEAQVGEVIRFNFLSLNHTLTQSSFTQPCTNLGGFSTGFRQFNPKNVSGEFTVDYVVDTLDPQWFFCTQTKAISHCHAGMVFALNVGDGIESFISAATISSTATLESVASSLSWNSQLGSLAATTTSDQPPTSVTDSQVSATSASSVETSATEQSSSTLFPTASGRPMSTQTSSTHSNTSAASNSAVFTQASLGVRWQVRHRGAVILGSMLVMMFAGI